MHKRNLFNTFNNFSTVIFPIRKITRLIHKIYNKQRSHLHIFYGIIVTMLHPKDTQSLKVSHDTSPTNSIREHRVSFLLMLDDFLSLLFLFSPLPANHARSIIVHFRFASFSIRAPVSATWPNNASQRKIERARGTKISVHRGSRARDALRASNTRGRGGGGKGRVIIETPWSGKKEGAHRGKLICREPLSTPFLHDRQKRKKSTRLPLGVRTVTSSPRDQFSKQFFPLLFFLKFHEGKISIR